MPQLDILIFSTQISFVFLFWLGYFVFVKLILPIISMEMKLKQKKTLNHMIWFKIHLNQINFFKLSFGKLMVKTRGILNNLDFIFSKKTIFFGIYQPDLLFFKYKNINKK